MAKATTTLAVAAGGAALVAGGVYAYKRYGGSIKLPEIDVSYGKKVRQERARDARGLGHPACGASAAAPYRKQATPKVPGARHCICEAGAAPGGADGQLRIVVTNPRALAIPPLCPQRPLCAPPAGPGERQAASGLSGGADPHPAAPQVGVKGGHRRLREGTPRAA